ncbi:histidine ammonia-lyase [Thalassospira profundimaris]|uniref:Histidine ammonia-lyase n=1 Tax=Thalassospira profundimaris TaxID=502049 RepID=A0A367WX47_9PROT|nr:histidine ammonia-lyase [Thalassospira profundimaris]RCK45280.1 histidine ammonia-lyase [Thalassospira profundimaris]
MTLPDVILDVGLTWREIAAIANGAPLTLADAPNGRIEKGRKIVNALVDRGIRAYGITTGVGALADTVVDRSAQAQLSRNIILSHACGTGPLLSAPAVRAIIAAQINNFAHGYSGICPETVAALQALLNHDCIPAVPSKGSAGYLIHMAHIALVLIGEGRAMLNGQMLSGAEALTKIGLKPLTLQAKEGLSLVNGTSCSAGLGAFALARAHRLADWADTIAAITLESSGAQMAAFDADILALRKSPGIQKVGATLRARLAGSRHIAQSFAKRTQDALSLRATPHAHGAVRDVFDNTAIVVNQELASVTDNPIVHGSPEDPKVASEAHAVAPALALALDGLAIAISQLSMLSERRLDRLVNPLVSGLPPFLTNDPGVGSGLMIAQYTAAALAAENRRLGAPASLDGGITSALQEDYLAHPTAAANKLLQVLDNTEQVLAIELLAAVQAADLIAINPDNGIKMRASGTNALYQQVRHLLPAYGDDHALASDLEALRNLIASAEPAPIP